MKKWKRTLCTLVASFLVCGTFSLLAAAEKITSGNCGDNAYWSVNEETKTLTISGTGAMRSYGDVTVYDDETSWGLEAYWNGLITELFADEIMIDTIYISDGITEIGDCAFYDINYRYDFTDIVIPGTVTSIGNCSFAHSGLTNVTIPDGVISVGAGAFRDCADLTEVQIPDSVKNIGVGAFERTGLTNVKIPGGVSRISANAFNSCKELISSEMTNGVACIGRYSFYDCSSLTEITIPSSVTAIEPYAFARCSSLTDIYFGGNEEDWQNIQIETGNESLQLATIHYNSTGPDGEEGSESGGETEPEQPDSGNDITNHTLTFHSTLGNTDVSIDTEWGWDLFLDNPSNRYDSRLAITGLALSAASEYSDERAKATLEELGFESNMILSQNYQADWHDLSSPGITFAHKSVQENGEVRHIIAVVIRGTTTISDVITDFGSLVDAFQTSAISVKEMLERYIDACSRNCGEVTEDNVTFFVTGHSLGGAVANQLAGNLTKQYGSSNVYAYTFAAPKTVFEVDITASNIFNLVNNEDSVPMLSTRWGWYGNACRFHRWDCAPDIYEQFATLTGGLDMESTMSSLLLFDAIPLLGKISQCAHAPETYMAYLLSRDDATYADVTPTPCIRVHCPVDVEVYTSQGWLVGRVTNSVVDTTIPTGVYFEIEGEEKNIYLPYEGDYTVRLTATDEGIMDYSVEEIDFVTGTTLKQKTFSNVKLTPGKEMESTLSVYHKNDSSIDTGHKTDIEDTKLLVLDQNNEPEKEILPDGNGTEVPIDPGDNPEDPNQPENPDDSTEPANPDSPGKTDEPPVVVIRPTYPVTITETLNGRVTVSPSRPRKGDLVTITTTPEDGYRVGAVTTTSNKDTVTVTGAGEGKYTFVQPASKVTITVTFVEDLEGRNPFSDVYPNEYYYQPVLWAVENDITAGTSATTFSPNQACTRAQAMTFLWRAEGCPEPRSTSNPFVDVKPDAYYYKAVLWAVENKVTAGVSATQFAPDEECTRGQIMTFIHRAAGSPSVSGSNPFRDVKTSDYFYRPILWAVKNNITNGMSATEFGPDNSCTRGQIVTFLYRYYA